MPKVGGRMSMLSAQIEELREVAYKVDEYQMGRERVPLKTAAIMREAADTIWQLRDDLQRTNAENARLRELVRDMWRDGMCECDERGACAECEYHYPDRMRELGVEVDE